VKLRLEPGEPGSGYQFSSEIREGQIPPEFIEPVGRGVREAANHGVLAGHEMVDLRAILYDGSYHAKDSNAMAFMIAGSIAFKEAAAKAFPIVLEPVMSVEAAVPERYLGDTVGDLNRRRGRIEGMEHQNAAVTIHAIVPLAEVLRSSAHGRLNYPMRFARYEPAPRRGWNGSDGVGVTANKPEGPRTGGGFASADPQATLE
jgi:elongation factor G